MTLAIFLGISIDFTNLSWILTSLLLSVPIIVIPLLLTFYQDRILYKQETALLAESMDLKQIRKNGLEDENVGGIVVVLETNFQYSDYKFLSPTQLGFQKILDPMALVNLVIEEKLKISDIVLYTDKGVFKIKFEIKNPGDDPIVCNLPKGQVFENKDYRVFKKTQNLAIAKHETIIIEPHKEIEFSFEAYCMNRSFGPPNGNPANITIFEIIDKRFDSQKSLWNQLGVLGTKIQKEGKVYSHKIVTNKRVRVWVIRLLWALLILYVIYQFIQNNIIINAEQTH